MIIPDRSILREYREAMHYLRQSPTATKIIDDLDRSGIGISVFPGDFDTESSGFTARGPVTESLDNFVEWVPDLPMHLDSGEWTSPALALFHELVHAHGWAFDPNYASRMYAYRSQQLLRDDHTPDEEARATRIEQTVARELGEPVRASYPDGHTHAENRSPVTGFRAPRTRFVAP